MTRRKTRHPVEPKYCPLCGSEDIKAKYENDGNGSYIEWYRIDCNQCQAGGTVSMWAKEVREGDKPNG